MWVLELVGTNSNKLTAPCESLSLSWEVEWLACEPMQAHLSTDLNAKNSYSNKY